MALTNSEKKERQRAKKAAANKKELRDVYVNKDTHDTTKELVKAYIKQIENNSK